MEVYFERIQKLVHGLQCHDLSFGLVTKARAWKGAGRACNPGVTFTLLRVWESEGMSPHTPKWTPTLGVRIPMDSQIFKKRCEG